MTQYEVMNKGYNTHLFHKYFVDGAAAFVLVTMLLLLFSLWFLVQLLLLLLLLWRDMS